MISRKFIKKFIVIYFLLAATLVTSAYAFGLFKIWKTTDLLTSEKDTSYTWGMSSDLDGRIYAYGYEGTNWLIRRSDSKGANWQTIDSVPFPDAAFVFAADGCNLKDYIFASGTVIYPDGTSYLITRRSKDAGRTWETVDRWTIAGSSDMEVRRTAVNKKGHVYVVGYSEGVGNSIWLVRRSLDFGQTWETVDTYSRVKDGGAWATGVAFDPKGNVYVSGSSSDTADLKGIRRHEIRRSVDNGQTWETIDLFLIPEQKWTFPTTLHIDQNGNIYTVGSYGIDNKIMRSAFVRRSIDGGKNWKIIDKFMVSGGSDTVHYEVKVGPTGDLYVAGKGTDKEGTFIWYLRQLTNRGWTNVDWYKGSHGLGAWPTDIAFDRFGSPVVGGLSYTDIGILWTTRSVLNK